MAFRKLKGVPMPERAQGLIYFIALNYDTASQYTKRKIEKICESAGGEYASALFELVTSGRTVPQVANKHYISPDVLARCRMRFYMLW